MKLGDLSPNEKNPRVITDKQKSMLKKSLNEFGDLSGIVYNRRTKKLIGGHQRKTQLPNESIITYTRQLNTPTKTGTVAEGFIAIGEERFVYREVDVDETREKAMNLAANKQGGDFDMPMVTEWLTELKELDFDLELTGFDDFLIKKESSVDEDEVPEVKEPLSVLGDIYELGNHRLMCGDSTSIDAVEKLMNGANADITFTSPPYNAAKNGHLTGEVSGFDNKYQNHNDAMSDDDYLNLLTGFTDLAVAKSKYCFVNIQLLTHNRAPLFKYQSHYQSLIKDILIWNKKQCPPNFVKGAFNTKWEYVFCFSSDSKTRGFPCDWRGQHPNVIETESNASNEFAGAHKAGFPVAFPVWFLEKFDFVQSVYEPFCGTGTTIIAAEKLNRKCYGMEIDPKYCDIAVTRWCKYTGQTKVKRNGEEITWAV
jgi:DNA modification methylase